MKDRDTPLRLVRKLEKVYDDPYHYVEACTQAKADGTLYWPDYCPLPIAAAAEYIAQFTCRENAAGGAAELIACWAWRKNPVVYSFDVDLSEALTEQAGKMEDLDVLPMEILLHLPYPCIYVKVKSRLFYGNGIDGFFAWIEYDLKRKAPELRIQLVADTMDSSAPMVLHLIDGSIKECIQDTQRETNRHIDDPVDLETVSIKTEMRMMIPIQHLLYLSAQNADIEDAPLPTKVDRSKRKITPGSPKAGDVIEKQVGVRIGASLRKSYRSTGGSAGTGTGTAKRSHTRRGHWHNYWTGSKDGERKLILKWTAPTVIHPEAADNDTVVIYPVKN